MANGKILSADASRNLIMHDAIDYAAGYRQQEYTNPLHVIRSACQVNVLGNRSTLYSLCSTHYFLHPLHYALAFDHLPAWRSSAILACEYS